MRLYGLFVGKNENGTKSTVELEEDLIFLLKKHNADFHSSNEDSNFESSFFGFGEEKLTRKTTTKLYEVLGKGAINTIISNQRDIEVQSQDRKFDGLVTLLGFEESSAVFQSLNYDILQLCAVYSPDRK